MVVQHATFDDDSFVGDVHLVRSPAPRPRQRHQRERTGKDQPQQHLVFVDEMDVFRAEDHQASMTIPAKQGRTVPRATGVTEMIFTSPSRKTIRGAIRIKRKDSSTQKSQHCP